MMASAKLAPQLYPVVISAETQTSAPLVLQNFSQSAEDDVCAAKGSQINIQTQILVPVNVMMAGS
jgi:hypothetical protein